MEAHTPIPFKHIQGWFFDLDGTLMDTDDQAVDSLAHRLQLFGSARAKKLARWAVMAGESPGNAAVTLADAAGIDHLVFGLRARLSHSPAPTFRLIDGVTPVLTHLAQHVRLAVVSTRSQADAHAFLEQHNLGALFGLVVTQESTRRLKPHPEPVLYAARTFGLPVEACVMVGDTPVDMRSARRAGAWAIGVLCGFGTASELNRAGAHLVLSSTADLLDLLASETQPG